MTVQAPHVAPLGCVVRVVRQSLGKGRRGKNLVRLNLYCLSLSLRVGQCLSRDDSRQLGLASQTLAIR